MKKLFASIIIALTATSVLAGPTCDSPKKSWMNKTSFIDGLKKQGYTIKKFKVSKGNCYEIYGFDKAGKKVETYFNPVTAAVLETEQ